MDLIIALDYAAIGPPFLFATAAGLCAGLGIAKLTGRWRALPLAGVLGGAVGGLGYYALHAGAVRPFLQRQAVAHNDLRWTQPSLFYPPTLLIIFGLALGLGLLSGAIGSLLAVGLSRSAPRRLRLSLMGGLATTAALVISYLACDYFLTPRIQLNERATLLFDELYKGGTCHPVVNQLAFSPDGKVLASVCESTGSVRLWEVDSGQERATLVPVFENHRAFAEVAFSPDGAFVAAVHQSATADRLLVWDAASAQKIRELGAAFNLAWGLKVRDPISGMEIGPCNGGTRLLFAPDGKTLAFATKNGMSLWGWQSKEEPINLDPDSLAPVAFAADSQTVACGCANLQVRVWDVATGKNVARLEGHTDRVVFLAFQGEQLITVSAKEAKTWDLVQRRAISTISFDGNAGPIMAAALSSDGKVLATATARRAVLPGPNEVNLWDLPSAKATMTLSHPGAIDSVAFSRDGKTLLTLSLDNQVIAIACEQPVRMWDVATGRKLASFSTGRPAAISSAALSPDGKTLAVGGQHWYPKSGDQCGMIRMFDVQSLHRSE
jgi:WD40 repeat protein